MLLSGLLLKSSDQHSNLGGLIPDFISYSIFFYNHQSITFEENSVSSSLCFSSIFLTKSTAPTQMSLALHQLVYNERAMKSNDNWFAK